MGEELFQNNAIPSDTDFRIFRDYGNIPGMDFAYSTNGYVYHTKHDRQEIVPDGTLQHTGDNILALVRALANAEELNDPESYMDDSAVFFDFMNWFMVYYTRYESVIVNSVIIVFCLILQIVSHFISCVQSKETVSFNYRVPRYLVVQLVSLLAACGVAFALNFFYDYINLEMSWYNNSWMILFLYMCPMFFVMSVFPAIVQRFTSSKKILAWDLVDHSLNFHSIILMLILITTIILRVRTGFMVMVPLFFYAISLMLQILVKILRVAAGWRLLIHYVVQLVPFAFYSTWTVIAFATFIPFAGRNGVDDWPEMVISGFAIAMGLLLAGFLIPTIPMYKSPIGVSLSFLLLFLIGILMLATPLGFPYKAETAPQRQNVYVSGGLSVDVENYPLRFVSFCYL